MNPIYVFLSCSYNKQEIKKAIKRIKKILILKYKNKIEKIPLTRIYYRREAICFLSIEKKTLKETFNKEILKEFFD